jgi:hypothetical protein
MARTFPTALVLAPNPDTPEAVQMLVEELEPSVLKKLPAQELIVLWLTGSSSISPTDWL